MSVQQIPLSRLNMSGGTQLRAHVNEDVIREYAEHLDQLPPIGVVFDGAQYVPFDGFHRIAAFSTCGRKEIPAEVQAGTIRDAILLAASSNTAHGLRRTNADKRRAIETLLRDQEWRQATDRWIADQVRVDHKTVAAVRAEMFPKAELGNSPTELPRTGRDGKQYPAARPKEIEKPAATADQQARDESVLDLFQFPQRMPSDDFTEEKPRWSGRPIITTAEVLGVTPVEPRHPPKEVGSTDASNVSSYSSGVVLPDVPECRQESPAEVAARLVLMITPSAAVAESALVNIKHAVDSTDLRTRDEAVSSIDLAMMHLRQAIDAIRGGAS